MKKSFIYRIIWTCCLWI